MLNSYSTASHFCCFTPSNPKLWESGLRFQWPAPPLWMPKTGRKRQTEKAELYALRSSSVVWSTARRCTKRLCAASTTRIKHTSYLKRCYNKRKRPQARFYPQLSARWRHSGAKTCLPPPLQERLLRVVFVNPAAPAQLQRGHTLVAFRVGWRDRGAGAERALCVQHGWGGAAAASCGAAEAEGRMLSSPGASTAARRVETLTGCSQPWPGWLIISLWWAMTLRRQVGTAVFAMWWLLCAGRGIWLPSSHRGGRRWGMSSWADGRGRGER